MNVNSVDDLLYGVRCVLSQREISRQRILLIGASGWFGRSILEIIRPIVSPDSVLCIASAPSTLTMVGQTWRVYGWSRALVSDFAPSLIINLALLTRDQVKVLGEESYNRINSQLLDEYEWSCSLESVRCVVTASSGAVSIGPNDAYKRFKVREERITRGAERSGRAAVIARAYSVSGPWVREPRRYAFSDLVSAALKGADLEITSQKYVWRRYTDAGEYLSVSVALALQGWCGVLESGGDLIEIASLAEKIKYALNQDVRVKVSKGRAGSDSYFSDNLDWLYAQEKVGLRVMPLEDQIKRTASQLMSSTP